jgi:hypothetical protein
MTIHCMYGVGRSSERQYLYQDAENHRSEEEVHSNNDHNPSNPSNHNSPIDSRYGVHLSQSDSECLLQNGVQSGRIGVLLWSHSGR